LGEKSKIRVSTSPATRVGFFRKTIECKESRIGKQPIPVPSNVTIKLEGQDIQVKGPLGELSLTYPREVKVERQEEGILRVSKAVETRRANQMHGLFRYFILMTCFFNWDLNLFFILNILFHDMEQAMFAILMA
jgi:large subunit ribosomal protein L6